MSRWQYRSETPIEKSGRYMMSGTMVYVYVEKESVTMGGKSFTNRTFTIEGSKYYCNDKDRCYNYKDGGNRIALESLTKEQSDSFDVDVNRTSIKITSTGEYKGVKGQIAQYGSEVDSIIWFDDDTRDQDVYVEVIDDSHITINGVNYTWNGKIYTNLDSCNVIDCYTF